MAFIPEFSEPGPHWPRPPTLPPSASEGAPRAAGVAPRVGSPASPHTGRIGPNPRLKFPPYMYNSDNPETKTVTAWIDTAPNGMEAPTPSPDR